MRDRRAGHPSPPWRPTFALLFVSFFALVGGVQAAAAADAPKLPDQVASYFASDLVPRLADLYGPGGTDAAPAFDETTKVGTISRVLAWTEEFTRGSSTDSPTELTNSWIAPVTDKGGTVLGLATVWINPGNDQPELADFDLGKRLAAALATAPSGTQLVHDPARSAWFATDGTLVTPLVAGTSGLTKPAIPADYQKLLLANARAATPTPAGPNPGLVVAGITLSAVVVLLAVFILLPGRKRRDADDVAGEGPDAAPAAVESVSVTAPAYSGPAATRPSTSRPAGAAASPAKKPAPKTPEPPAEPTEG